MRYRRSLLPILAAACVLSARPALAQWTGGTEQVRVTAVASHTSVEPGARVAVAIRLRIAPGWHIYPPEPAEFGLPTRITWRAPGGTRLLGSDWPAPIPRRYAGILVDSYEDEIVVRTELRLPRETSGQAVRVEATIRWGVCREVCLDQEVVVPVRIAVSPEGSIVNPAWNLPLAGQ